MTANGKPRNQWYYVEESIPHVDGENDYTDIWVCGWVREKPNQLAGQDRYEVALPQAEVDGRPVQWREEWDSALIDGKWHSFDELRAREMATVIKVMRSAGEADASEDMISTVQAANFRLKLATDQYRQLMEKNR